VYHREKTLKQHRNSQTRGSQLSKDTCAISLDLELHSDKCSVHEYLASQHRRESRLTGGYGTLNSSHMALSANPVIDVADI